MKKGKFLSLAVMTFTVLSLFLIGSSFAQAGLLNTVNEGGLAEIGNRGYGSNTNTVLDPRVMIARTISKLLGFLGIVMVVLIIYSGWQYMTAEGDKTKLEEAKKRIVNATIGLVIIISAYSIANFVIECSSFVTDKGILTNLMCQ